MVGFGNAVSVVIVWCLSLDLTCCAVLRDEVQFDAKDIVDPWNYQERVRLGSKSKVQPGEFLFQIEEIEPLAGDLHEDGYQADQAGWSMVQDAPKSVAGAAVPAHHEVQKILGTKPAVECAEDAMSLKLRGAPAAYESGLFLDQDAGPPLPLSKVPSGCGVQVHRRWWGLILTVPFVGCFGAQESDAYTLPIHLSGLPAKLSCPLTRPASKPFSVLCNSSGMIVKTPKVTHVDDLWVKVKKEWLPVLKAAVRCNFSVLSESDGLVLSSPYKPCMVLKDGVYSIHVAVEKEIKLFCPVAPPTSPSLFASPTSAPSPPVLPNAVQPAPSDMSLTLRPVSSASLESALFVLPTTSSPPVANSFDSSLSNLQPTSNLTLEPSPALNFPNVSFDSNLASTQPTANVTLEPGPALDSPDFDSSPTTNLILPTTSLPLESGTVVSWSNDLNPGPADSQLIPTTPSPLTDGPAPNLPGVAHDLWAAGQPIMPTTSSPLPVSNWMADPLNPGLAGLRPTEMPPTSEPALTTTTSSPPVVGKPWYPVYPHPKPVGGRHKKPKLPGTTSTSDSLHNPALSFPGPVPPYFNPLMHYNPGPIHGANYDQMPYWFNQPYFYHGHQYPYSYPVFSPNMADPNLSVPSNTPCKDKRSCLQNQVPHYFPSNMGEYNQYSAPVGTNTPVGEVKSVKRRSKPLKIVKSWLF